MSGMRQAVDPPSALAALLHDLRACVLCAQHLPFGPRPVVRASATARILIVGQAPGTRVHATGIPWNDPSGNRLREWLRLDQATFYDETRIAIVPMGFCYPGKGRSGDHPPRPECAPTWHTRLLQQMPALRLRLLIGRYAQAHYLGQRQSKSLTETVRAYADYGPYDWPLPHPSPRNLGWLKRNPWFEGELLPVLRRRVHTLLGTHGLDAAR